MVAIRRRIVAFLITLITLISLSIYYRYQLQNTLSYASRPLWDTPDGPKNLIPHFYAPGVEPSAAICKLHGYDVRVDVEGGKEVWDAVLLSTELDLLEVRMNELDGVVDQFFVIESDRTSSCFSFLIEEIEESGLDGVGTFTGLPKPTYFKEALKTPRFSRFAPKITYALHPGRIPKPGESPFAVEAEQRAAMTRLLSSSLPATGRSPPLASRPTPPPLVIMSDVDEIPAAHTIKLVKTCAFPRVLHLQLRNYVYSFEWPSGWGSWRAAVHEWSAGSFYRHSMAGDVVLADAGWHCR
ncbi:hypothetical protein FRC12_001734 [Ceratobasidium sp. 428]|nr:hypothetical protein FRC12_001734 [Ceratobasidium sp. 428]